MLKMDAIKQAGLTQRTANRYEEVAGRRDMQAQVARRAAAEHRFAAARTDVRPTGETQTKRQAIEDVGPRNARPVVAGPVGRAWPGRACWAPKVGKACGQGADILRGRT
jgi:hypothetical protein